MLHKFRARIAAGSALLVLAVPLVWFAAVHHQVQAASPGPMMNHVIAQANPGAYHFVNSTQHSMNLTTVADVPVHSQPPAHRQSQMLPQRNTVSHTSNAPLPTQTLTTPPVRISGTPSNGLSGPYDGGFDGQVHGNPALAVGPGYGVEMMWPWIAVFSVDPTTHYLLTIPHTTKTLNAFFGVDSSASFDEPKAFYDPGTQRYFVAALDDNGADSSSLFLATSKTSNPTGSWTITKIAVQGYNLYGTYMYTLGFGFDSKAIYITVHLFLQSDPSNYLGALLGAMCKAYLTSGSTAGCGTLGSRLGYYTGLKEFDGLADHIMPTLTYDALAAELFVDVDTKTSCDGQSDLYCHFTVWALSDPLNTALLSGVSFVNTSYMPSPNTTDLQGELIVTAEVFIDAAPVWRANGLYVSLSSGVNNGTSSTPNIVPGIAWYIFAPTLTPSSKCSTCVTITGSPSKTTQVMSFSGNIGAFNPSQMVDPTGDVCFTYSIAGGIYNPTSAIDCRSSTMLLITPSSPHVLAVGALYGLAGYSIDTATAWDPASCTALGCHGMIGVGMFTKPYNSYGTAASIFDYSIITP